MVALCTCLICALPGCRREPAPRRFVIQPVWFAGVGDAERADLDRFLACLLEQSTLEDFWQGGVRLQRAQSVLLPAPATAVTVAELPGVLAPALAAAGVPLRRADGADVVLLVFAGAPLLRMTHCGRNDTARIDGVEVGLALVRTAPLCWPTGDPLRSETQVATHEIVETVDRLLGFGTCAGGGACNASALCPDPCATFVGLQCAGAPMGTLVGCGGRKVDGWVVQRFSPEGREPGKCERCTPCSFVPEVRPPAAQ